jgi:starch-binding outer membrane protein, SusD/RagB family
MKIATKHPLLVGTALLTIATGGLYACKDFLGAAAAPQGTLDEATLANAKGVEGSLIAAYRSLDCTSATNSSWGCAASNWVYGSVLSDDAYAGSTFNDQPGITDLELYSWGTGNAEIYLNTKWRAMYEGVVRSNSTLRLLKSVLQASPTAFSTADAKGIEGEAIFLRAHYHFEAWRMWANIPYYREDDTDFRKANLLSAAVVTEILKDLDAAIALLPTDPRNGQKGRATQWTAKAYKGRLLVYNNQHDLALQILREVRASTKFALQPSYDQVWTGYQDFTNGPETIFAFQASANDGEPDGTNANWGERLNFPSSGSPLGCCGFHQPSQNLVNYFKVDAAGLPLALSAPSTWNASNANFTSASTAPVDPRVDWTVGRDGVPFKDWGVHGPGWVRQLSNGGPYSAKKNVHEQSSGAQSTVGWQNTQLNSVNIHIFRYADLLLLLAEAEVEAGSLENARAIVNEIRARAGVKVQGPGDAGRASVAVTDPTPLVPTTFSNAAGPYATYQVGLYNAVWTDPVFARNAVRAERRLELAMEGQRFFDLRRWGISIPALNAYLDGVGGGNEKARLSYKTGAGPLVAPKHLLFPIPNIQIELSKGGGGLTQNAGW